MIRCFARRLVGLVSCLAIGALPGSADELHPLVEIQREYRNPDPTSWWLDVRWASADTVFVAAAKSGVLEIAIRDLHQRAAVGGLRDRPARRRVGVVTARQLDDPSGSRRAGVFLRVAAATRNQAQHRCFRWHC